MEIVAKVSVETAEAVKSVEALTKQIESLEKNLEEGFTFDGIEDELAKAKNELSAIGGAVEEIPVKEVTENFKTMGSTIDSMVTNGINLLGELGIETQGIRRAYEGFKTVTDSVTKSQQAQTIATRASSFALTGFRAALVATGIGAFVVLLGTLLANWKDIVDVITEGTTVTRAYAEANKSVQGAVAKVQSNLFELTKSIELARDGLLDKDEVLDQYNNTLGSTVGYATDLNQAEELMITNGALVIQITKEKAFAEALYAKAAEARAKVIVGDESLEPDFWESLGSALISGGNGFAFLGNQVDNVTENITDLELQALQLEGAAGSALERSAELAALLQSGSLSPKEIGQLSRSDLGAQKVEGIEPLDPNTIPEIQRDELILASSRELSEELRLIDEATQERRRLEAEAGLATAQANLDANLSILKSFAGKESAIGKAAFIAKQALRVQESLAIAKDLLGQLQAKVAVAGADLSTGAAKTASAVPFPANIPLLIGFAAQAATIYSSIKAAVNAAKGEVSRIGGGSGGGGGGGGFSAPSFQGADLSFLGEGDSASASDFQDLDEEGNQTQGIKAFVVGTDITGQQNIDQKVRELASLNGD
jgi:hypothetical protein